MLVAWLSCWIGVGLWMLSTEDVARRVLRGPPSGGRRRSMRILGIASVIASALPLVGPLGAGLAGVAALLVTMSALSVAVVLAPLGPRLFAMSLPAAALALVALRLAS